MFILTMTSTSQKYPLQQPKNADESQTPQAQIDYILWW